MNNRGLQSFLAIGPLVLILALIPIYLIFIFSIVSNDGSVEEFPAIFAGGTLVLIVIIFFLIVALHLISLIYYIIHAAKNPMLQKDNMKVIWLIIIILVSTFGPFIYWLVEIRLKDPKPVIN